MPRFREKVDNSIKRLVGIVRVQGRQTQVTGFSERDGMLHGFLITYLTNQNNVWCLSQRVLQSNFKRVGISTDFALRNDTTFVVMNKFHRVFYGNDMAVGIFVSIVDHRSQDWSIYQNLYHPQK